MRVLGLPVMPDNMKVVYQSESLRPVLASLSRTAELATRLKLTGEKMASENWQVGI